MKHYDQGQDTVFEDKPVDIVKTSQILKYEISVKKFSGYYDFYNFEEVVEDFLNNVRSKFKSSGPGLIKCEFIIENIQQSVYKNSRPIRNTRYWSTDTYRANYFNDYVFHSLK